MKRILFLLLIFLLSCCGQKEVYTFTCHYQDEAEEWQNTYTVQNDEILQLNYRRTSQYAFSEKELQKMSELYNSLPGVSYRYQQGDPFFEEITIDTRKASLKDLHLYGFIEIEEGAAYLSSLQTLQQWRDAGFTCEP